MTKPVPPNRTERNYSIDIIRCAKGLNEYEAAQKPFAKAQSADYKEETIAQQVAAQIEQLFLSS